MLIAEREIPAADRAAEQNVADERQLRCRMMENDVAGRVTGTMAHVQGELADAHLVAVGEPDLAVLGSALQLHGALGHGGQLLGGGLRQNDEAQGRGGILLVG